MREIFDSFEDTAQEVQILNDRATSLLDHAESVAVWTAVGGAGIGFVLGGLLFLVMRRAATGKNLW